MLNNEIRLFILIWKPLSPQNYEDVFNQINKIDLFLIFNLIRIIAILGYFEVVYKNINFGD